jgi:hypothetical protein
MKNQQLLASRFLLADWFAHLAASEGVALPPSGRSGDRLTFGAAGGREVSAHFIPHPPYLEFVAKDPADQAVVAALVAKAKAKVLAGAFGSEVWYTFELREPPFNMFSPHSVMGGLMLRLGTQQRISGWRRLGGSVLLEFTEGKSPEANPDKPLLAPPAVVKVHVVVPGPMPGHFSGFVAHNVVEPIAAVCGFALGRSVDPPPTLFPSSAGEESGAVERRRDASVLTLARKGVSLDLFTPAGIDGGLDWSFRVRAALLTFDAGMRQERDSVANVLYVIAAESLTVPAAKWRHERLTARFVDYYLRELAGDLDTIVAHGNFEEAFDLKRAGKRSETLRKRLLLKIYGVRSHQVHEGLVPTYRGFGALDLGADMQRALIHDFAEAAILSYLRSPRSSLIGHPQLGCKQAGS